MTTRRTLLTSGIARLTAAAQSAPTGRFAGRHVLTTGATSGMGEVTARAFAREGAGVAFGGRRAELGARIEAQINGDAATRAAPSTSRATCARKIRSPASLATPRRRSATYRWPSTMPAWSSGADR